MHSARDTMQQQQQQQAQTHGSLGDLQYYEITPTNAPSRNDDRHHHPDNVPPSAHLHPINLCTVERLPPSGIISQHQLQDILPGAVFADPSMAHLHYHIIPSPRRSLNCSETGSQSGPSCRSHHPRLEQVHLHEHHQHYQRQPKFVRPPSSMSEMAKDRDRSSVNFDHLSRYSHMPAHDKNEKNKTISLAELSDSQATITGTKGSNSSKCQCHVMHELRLKRDREAIGIAPEDGEAAVNQHRHPPALPPRPPPRPSGRRLELPSISTSNQRHVGGREAGNGGGCCKKYVVLCCLCGGLSAAVGSLFLAVHAVLSAHTASLALFETVPSYIPGTMLIFMGLFTMLLARRKHRYGFLMKVCGSVSVVCALVCVLVTVTTTVVHMSRLQGLRECVYTARAKSCTCYGAPQSRASDPGVLFEGTPHCEAVHGALYACLRALFGVSVAGILACIFSCMLVYQLFSHEKKKMYWEQLELRCRSLYGQGAAAGLVSARPAGTCGCCNDCAGIGPWWAQSPGNLYTPNPDLAPSRRWRLPWSRSRGPAPTTDSNYGFHGQAAAGAGSNANQEALIDPTVGGIVPYSILGPQAGGAYSVLQAGHHEDHYGQGSAASPYSVLETAVPLWGPPPPYSDPNSPARRPMIAFPQADPRTRLTKRMENFQREVDYGRTSEIKRPSDNYENAEQVSNDTDTETSANNVLSSSGRVARNSSKHKKLLKGVDNAGFQPQETNSMPKQSESELYFGDVSSCCGPESSLYDVATEKDGKSEHCQADAGTSSYHSSSLFPKRPSSKRSRRQQQQQQQQQMSHQHDPSETVDMPRSNSSLSSSDDLPENAIVSYSVHTPTAVDYDLIRHQRRYPGSQSSYSDKSPKEEAHMNSEHHEDSDDGAYGAGEETEKKDNESEFKSDYDEDMRPVKV